MSIIANVSEHISVGDFIQTNGDGRDRVTPYPITGKVLKVGKKFFWIGHNDPTFQGKTDVVDPIQNGFSYVWCIGLNNRVARIQQSPGVIPTPNRAVTCEPCANPGLNVEILIPNKVKPMSIFKQMSVYLRRNLSASAREQVKAGFRDADLRLTQLGRSELLELLAAKFEEEFTLRAAQVRADTKAEQEDESEE